MLSSVKSEPSEKSVALTGDVPSRQIESRTDRDFKVLFLCYSSLKKCVNIMGIFYNKWNKKCRFPGQKNTLK